VRSAAVGIRQGMSASASGATLLSLWQLRQDTNLQGPGTMSSCSMGKIQHIHVNVMHIIVQGASLVLPEMASNMPTEIATRWVSPRTCSEFGYRVPGGLPANGATVAWQALSDRLSDCVLGVHVRASLNRQSARQVHARRQFEAAQAGGADLFRTTFVEWRSRLAGKQGSQSRGGADWCADIDRRTRASVRGGCSAKRERMSRRFAAHERRTR
jgi:hypothetical protein